ncbi:MAG: hypothetical protein OXK80_00800 [Bdellovibrionales bacterium]|nr:hypothetical protein [Bdellovibrionales bacterium]
MNFTVPPSLQDWIEVVPYGLVGGMAPGLSVLVFREKNGDNRFAIWLSKLQSQIAIEQGLRKEETFSFLNALLDAVNVQPKRCYFVKNKNGEQYVKVHFEGEKKFALTLKADQSLSFCIYHNCRFFCTMKFIESMREVRAGKHTKKVKREPPIYLN